MGFTERAFEVQCILASLHAFAVSNMNENSKYHPIDFSVTVAIVFSAANGRSFETFCK